MWVLTLPEARGHIESHLQGLLCIEARVAVCVVARVQVSFQDGGPPAQALRHIVSSHLQVQAPRHCAQLLMHVKERLHLWEALLNQVLVQSLGVPRVALHVRLQEQVADASSVASAVKF